MTRRRDTNARGARAPTRSRTAPPSPARVADTLDPQHVRSRILEAASELFYREGIQASGIQRVLGEAGAARASLYDHFGSKDELIAAYLARRGAEWREQLTGTLASTGGDARTRLLTLFDLVAALVRSPDFRGCPFHNAASELATIGHPGRAVVREHRAWLRELVAGLAREAVGPAGEDLAGALVALHDGAMASALLDERPEAGADARWAAERLLDGLGSPSARSK